MGFTDEVRQGLNTALNEATFLNLRVNNEQESVDLLFSILTLPPSGPEPTDPRIVIRLQRVSRIAASLRAGSWNDENAEVATIELADLSDTVRSFGGVPIYGAGFFDSSDDAWSRWANRLSVDETLGEGDREHWIELFQAGGTARHLDLRVWFDDFTIYDMERRIVSIDDFISGGHRWWDALYAGDERVQGHGIGVFRSD
jgi:hypothetical protein